MFKNLTIILAILCCFSNCQFIYNEGIAKNLAGFAIQSYCNNNSILTNNCGPPCQQNPQGLYEVKEVYNSNTNARAILGYSPDNDAIIISFRGSTDIINFINNIQALQIPYSRCSGCQVHSGFLKHYQSIEQQVGSAFNILKQNHPNSKIYLTGHSLGAATATLALPYLYSLNNNQMIDAVYHFSSPRVGNKAFSDWLKSSSFSILYGRITYYQDPVVHMPNKGFPLNYYHTNFEVFYLRFNDPQIGSKLCLNAEDTQCANQFLIAFNTDDHLNILGWDLNAAESICDV